MLFGSTPFASSSRDGILTKLSSSAPVRVPERPAVSVGAAELLQRMLQRDPAARIDFLELFTTPYLDMDHRPGTEGGRVPPTRGK